MDGFEEKKWFVYLGDHHEGPFSVTEIQAKMHEGQVTSSSYVWAEGMQDWLVMTEVAAFETLFKPTLVPTPQAFPEPEAFSTDDFALPEPMLEARPVGDGPSAEIRRGEQPGRAAETIELDRVQLTTSRPAAASQRMDDVEPSDVPEPKRRGGRGKGRYLFLLVVALVGGTIYYASHSDPNAQPPALRAGLQAIAGATQPLLGKLAEAAPFLARWISPIPALQDVSPEDYAELRKAAGASLEREGPRAAVALSTADPLTPTFYVATNLPDGAIVDVYVEGVPETLLYQLGFSSRVSVTITKKLGISTQVK
ncbi:MAG: DUF4339 domain-containing protein, partial [Oligoflexia bacterium]|nr:DUF4339 domain-containing protein [Oligoflexia bacterium]